MSRARATLGKMMEAEIPVEKLSAAQLKAILSSRLDVKKPMSREALLSTAKMIGIKSVTQDRLDRAMRKL